MPVELTNKTGTYLQDLNDYCLLEIFSSDLITPKELCSLAETCKRFKQLTQRVFPKKFGIECCRVDKYKFQLTTKDYDWGYFTVRGVERILKNFGQHLSTLTLRDMDVAKLAAKYCGDVTLRRLQIYKLESIEGLAVCLNTIFQRLPALTVDCCDFRKDVTSNDLNCDSLIELEILYTLGCDAVLKHTFPNLERLTLNGYATFGTDYINILFDFVRRHRQLKAIKLAGLCDEGLCDRVPLLSVINNCCKELEELTLECFLNWETSTIVSTMENFAKLKMLDVEFACCSKYSHIVPLLNQGLQSLETIKIMSAFKMSRHFFDALSQQPNLRELYLTYCPIKNVPWTKLTRLRKVYLHELSEFNTTDLLNIVRDLINLKILECYVDHVVLNEEVYLDIVKIVQPREHVLTLKCYCNFNPSEKCDESQKVKTIKLN